MGVMRREEIELERPDAAGEFVLLAMRIVVAVCICGSVISLLVLLIAVQDGWPFWPALSAAFFMGVAIVSIAWCAFWTKLKGISQDMYVIRQILEHREFGGSRVNAEDERRVG